MSLEVSGLEGLLPKKVAVLRPLPSKGGLRKRDRLRVMFHVQSTRSPRIPAGGVDWKSCFV
jgi:hypothetical protein